MKKSRFSTFSQFTGCLRPWHWSQLAIIIYYGFVLAMPVLPCKERALSHCCIRVDPQASLIWIFSNSKFPNFYNNPISHFLYHPNLFTGLQDIENLRNYATIKRNSNEIHWYTSRFFLKWSGKTNRLSPRYASTILFFCSKRRSCPPVRTKSLCLRVLLLEIGLPSISSPFMNSKLVALSLILREFTLILQWLLIPLYLVKLGKNLETKWHPSWS